MGGFVCGSDGISPGFFFSWSREVGDGVGVLSIVTRKRLFGENKTYDSFFFEGRC